jgi:hypothetical protein
MHTSMHQSMDMIKHTHTYIFYTAKHAHDIVEELYTENEMNMIKP